MTASREDLTGRAATGALTELASTGEVTPETEAGVAPPRTQWELFRRRFFHHKLAVAALITLLLLCVLAIFAPLIAPYPLNPPLDAKVLAEANQGPSLKHLFGTDELGRDQFTRIIYAGRISLVVGFGVALLSVLVGTAIGALAGYLGGRVDQLLMRLTDLILVVPALAILMIASKGLGGSVEATVIILSALFWMPLARVVRGVFLSLKEKEYVEAARASGASSGRIMVRHMLPNTIGPIVVNGTLTVGLAILTESTLSFLGFGVQPPTVTWGNMLAQSAGDVGTNLAYLIYFPGLVITLTVLAANYLGDGLRDALDPSAIR